MNVFDILGPVMIGPSSSHTAGAARIGRITRTLLGGPAVKADILLHGSFAKTYKGHGTDKALIAGIMGMATDDVRIARHRNWQSRPDLMYTFPQEILTSPSEHCKSYFNRCKGPPGISPWFQHRRRKYPGNRSKRDGSFPYGQYATLIVLHKDAPGTIAAVTEVMAEEGINICNFRLSRQKKGGEAVMTIELDGKPSPEINKKINTLPNIYSSTMLQPI